MERKLPSRRKRASKGRVIRISNLVYDALNEQRFGRSWDFLLRKLLGLPDRQGNQQLLVEGMLETITGKFFLRDPEVTWDRLEQDVYEAAILEAARKKLKRVSKPLKMKELP